MKKTLVFYIQLSSETTKIKMPSFYVNRENVENFFIKFPNFVIKCKWCKYRNKGIISNVYRHFCNQHNIKNFTDKITVNNFEIKCNICDSKIIIQLKTKSLTNHIKCMHSEKIKKMRE